MISAQDSARCVRSNWSGRWDLGSERFQRICPLTANQTTHVELALKPSQCRQHLKPKSFNFELFAKWILFFSFLLVKDIFSGWLDSESWVVWSSGAIESRIRKAERTPLSGGAAATQYFPPSAEWSLRRHNRWNLFHFLSILPRLQSEFRGEICAASIKAWKCALPQTKGERLLSEKNRSELKKV